MSTPFVPVGRIVKAHGLRGEVSVAAVTGDPLELPTGLHVWIVPPPVSVRQGTIEGVRPGPKGPLMKISGIDDIAVAKEVSGRELAALPSDLPAGWMPDEEPDPVGLRVVLEDGEQIGTVSDVIATGANDVWVVAGEREVLVPVIEEVVLEVDREAGRAVIRPLPGMMDED